MNSTMKWSGQFLSSSRLGAALALSFALGATAFAQDTDSSKSKPVGMSSSSNEEKDSTVHSRFWVGIYGSGTPFGTVSTHNSTDSNGDTFSAAKSGGIAGGGLDFNLRVRGNYWLNIGVLYRYSGYDSTENLNDTSSTIYTERTRAHLFDIPVLARYAGPRWRWSKYSFYELGGVLRYAASPTTTLAAANVNGDFCCAPPSTVAFRRTIEGVSVGTGLVAKDDFGIKVAPEVRYVRWLGDTWRSSTLGTAKDQLEVGISFGF